jgi:hypothetical protein
VPVERVSSTKYLGVYIDEQLNFKKHVSYVAQKIRFGAYVIGRLRLCADDRLLKILYYSFIQSHLQYVICAWGGVYLANVRPVIMCQKRVIRYVCKAGYIDHTEPLFNLTGILPFRNLYAFSICKYALKRNIIATLPVSHGARRQYFTYRFIPKSTRMQQSFEVHVVKLLNKLPREIMRYTPSSIRQIKLVMQNLNVEETLAGLHSDS